MNFEKNKFELIQDIDSGELFENIAFNKCTFEYCNISRTENPEYRTRIKNIQLTNCSATSCGIGCAEIENVSVNSLKTNGMTQIYGAVFKNVKLEGRFGKMIINNRIHSEDEDIENAFIEANKDFYKNVDIALDISKADFLELNIRGISADLIKYNPEFHAVIRKENIPNDWENIKFNTNITEVMLDNIKYMNLEDYIYMAWKRNKYFKEILEDIKLLRKLGIADAD